MTHTEGSLGDLHTPNCLEPYMSPNMLIEEGFLRFGYGVKTYSDGSVYEGNFLNGERSGFGKCVKPSGNTYEGEWKNDRRHGKGVEWYSDGSTYKGNFVDGRKHGLGIYRNPEGGSYEGKWKAGKPHGHGTETFSDGTTYVGEFVEGKMHGKGNFAKADGYRYQGEFKYGLRHGKGVEYYPDGSFFEGIFYKGTSTDTEKYMIVNPEDTQLSRGRLRHEGMEGGSSLKDHGVTRLGSHVRVSTTPTSRGGGQQTTSVACTSNEKESGSTCRDMSRHQSIPSKMSTIPPMPRAGDAGLFSRNESLHRVSTSKRGLD